MAKYNNRYNNQNNRGKMTKNTYHNNDYQDRMKPWYKRINKGPIFAILLALALFGGTYYFTNGFYSEHLLSWQMKKAWFCPYDYKVYEENDNALITKDNLELKKNGKSLVVTLNAENISVEDRIYVTYTVLYYSGEDCVYQTKSISAVYDALGGGNSKIEMFRISDIDENGPYYSKTETGVLDTSKELKVDSIRVAVMYNNSGKSITILQQKAFSEAIMISYVDV